MAASLTVTGCAVTNAAAGNKTTVTAEAETETSAGDTETMSADAESSEGSSTEDGTAEESTEGLLVKLEDLDLTDQFSDRDLDSSYDESTAVKISLNGDSADVTGEGASAENGVVTITAAGTYVISGTLNKGQIVVDAADTDKVQLVLDNASITADENAAILMKNADKVFLTLAAGSTNTLADSAQEYVQPEDMENTVDGVVFSVCDLTLNGSGTLNVTAGYKHGIVCKDDLVITDGTYNITSAGKGISANDSIRIKEGEMNITAEDDAIHTSKDDTEGKGYIYIEGGTLKLSSGDDGIHAATALVIAGGEIDVTKSYEGLEGDTMDIQGGEINVAASDDGLNASSNASASDNQDDLDFADHGKRPEEGGEDAVTSATPRKQDGTSQKSFGAEAADASQSNSAEDTAGAPQEPSDRSAQGMPEKPADGEKPSDGEKPANGEKPVDGGRPSGGRGMHSDPYAYIRISGGTIVVNADGDGIDSNGSLYVDGGDFTVYGPTNNGNGAIDIGDGSDAAAQITGGSVRIAGSSGMAVTFDDSSSQYSVMYNFDEVQKAGTMVTLKDSDGNVILTMTPEKDFQSVIFSSSSLRAGSYTITAGDIMDTITVDSVSVTAGAASAAGRMPDNKEGNE